MRTHATGVLAQRGAAVCVNYAEHADGAEALIPAGYVDRILRDANPSQSAMASA